MKGIHADCCMLQIIQQAQQHEEKEALQLAPKPDETPETLETPWAPSPDETPETPRDPWALSPDETPEEFVCPITTMTMRDPVCAPDGHSCESSYVHLIPD